MNKNQLKMKQAKYQKKPRIPKTKNKQQQLIKH